MNKYFKIFALFLLAAAFASCKKFLDVTPKGVVIPKEVSEYEKMLNAPSITESFPQQILYMSDDVNTPFTQYEDAPDANAYFWKSQINSNAESNPVIWGPLYRSIYSTNVVINGIMDATGGSTEQKQRILGEALTMRAFYYFDLATVYAKAYDKATASQNPGLPIVTSIDVTEKTPQRSSLQATFDTITSNLKRAAEILPENSVNRARISKYVAWGLLSRVYLYMQDYENALLYADKALAGPHEFLDYNEFFDGYFTPISEENPQVLWHRLPNDVAAIYYVTYSPSLYELYSWDDMRAQLFAMDYYGLGEYMWNGPDFGTYGITYPEVYLTKAEALVRLNKVSEAMDMINDFRKFRIMADTYEPLTATDAADALDIVLSERRRELAMKGTRWADMKRLDALGEMGPVERVDPYTGEVLDTLEPGSSRYTFEIPLRVLRFNPGMEKNF